MTEKNEQKIHHRKREFRIGLLIGTGALVLWLGLSLFQNDVSSAVRDHLVLSNLFGRCNFLGLAPDSAYVMLMLVLCLGIPVAVLLRKRHFTRLYGMVIGSAAAGLVAFACVFAFIEMLVHSLGAISG